MHRRDCVVDRMSTSQTADVGSILIEDIGYQ